MAIEANQALNNNAPVNSITTVFNESVSWIFEWYEWIFGYAEGIRSHFKTPEETPSSLYKAEKNSFVKGVLGILLTMLVATAVVFTYVLATPAVKKLLEVCGWAILIPALIFLCVLYCGVTCASLRQSSCAFIFLYFEVMVVTIILGQISSQYKTYIIYYGVIATTVVVFVCFIIACSNLDFTSWILHVIVTLTALITISVIVLIDLLATEFLMKPLTLTILVIGTLFQVEMIVLQLQLILNKKSLKLNETDYSIAAFLLYISIITTVVQAIVMIAVKLNNQDD